MMRFMVIDFAFMSIQRTSFSFFLVYLTFQESVEEFNSFLPADVQ